MKTKEELNALKEEAENLGKKLAELTEEELSQVAGGRRAFLSAENQKIRTIVVPEGDEAAGIGGVNPEPYNWSLHSTAYFEMVEKQKPTL